MRGHGCLGLLPILYIYAHFLLNPQFTLADNHFDAHHFRRQSGHSHASSVRSSHLGSAAGSSVHDATISASSSLGSPKTSTSVLPPASPPSSAVSTSFTTPPTSTSPAANSDQFTIDPQTLQDIQTITTRRLSSIVGALSGSASSISAWISTLGPDGKWPDSEVDYTTGCDARRANWPAQTHWQRILFMSAAWHGGVPGADMFVKNPALRATISLAMDYWFGRDFTNLACLDSGGTAQCPCANPDNSLWNTNWFSNIILIPELVSQTCLLLNDTLAPIQLSNCTHMTGRAYGTFDHNINGVGFLTGANTLDVAKIGIDQGLLNFNVSLITDAYGRVHNELTIKDELRADGIRPDGSFGQHGGILYNGNYGKDYANDILDLEIEAAGTQFGANSTSQAAFANLFDGDKWMIFRNSLTGVLHWDFSALGRFISFPVIDNQATGSIKINLTEVQVLGQEWGSNSLTTFAESLSNNTSNANAGHLVGNRMFYDNDYMVHRGCNYVSTVKMYSSRTQNTECTNLQNPFGFHLSDGAHYTYIQGDEYEDISAAWDWNLIPGITIDYAATPLACGTTQRAGLEGFVGGTSDGHIGLAAMRYTNPLTKSLHWQKAWFFLDDDVQHIMVAGISSSTSAPVYSVLDQRRHSGKILVDNMEQHSVNRSGNFHSLWHGKVGYTFASSNNTLSIQSGDKVGNWTAIGTSTQPPPTVDLFAAWIQHNTVGAAFAYSMFPGTTASEFASKGSALRLQTVRNDAHISAIFNDGHNTAMAVFWDTTGGAISFKPAADIATATISVNGSVAVIYKLDTGAVTVSDPSQTLPAVEVTLTLGAGNKPAQWGNGRTKSLTFALPGGGSAGSSLTQVIQ
ncbi:polysaccharide lyase family 8 protein [Infundibulicybe gibba]|nr:polysaccharide lyase family 8 protein [Infundibulicybe gibba]